MAKDLYQCPCGRQYNDLMYACPACRLPYGHQPLAGNDLSLGVSSPSDGTPAAGWYPDPNGLPSDRYWDGESWTEQTRPQATPPQPPPPAQPIFVPGRYGANTSGGGSTQRAPERQMPPQNGLGTAALVFGIIAMFTPLIAPTLAVIFGNIGLKKCKRGEATNREMALWGIWLGWIAWVCWILLYIILLNTSLDSLAGGGRH